MTAINETMTRCKFPTGHIVRVWRQTEKFTMGPDREVAIVCDSIAESLSNRFNLGDLNNEAFAATIVQKILQIPDVNAVEVVDRNGNGGLHYPNWP